MCPRFAVGDFVQCKTIYLNRFSSTPTVLDQTYVFQIINYFPLAKSYSCKGITKNMPFRVFLKGGKKLKGGEVELILL